MQEQNPPQGAESTDISLRIGRLTMDPHRIIYSTILLMTAYAIYDEGDSPINERDFLALMGVSIAPLFALVMAHVFSDALDMQIRNARRLTGKDRRHLLVSNLQYLYVAIPPLLLIAVLGTIGWDADDIVSIVQLLGVLSLGWWGWFAGTKAGMARPRRAWFAFSYTMMGLVVIAVELVLTH